MRYLVAVCILIAQSAWAEHPIDVQRAAARGDFLQALAYYDKIPKRVMTTEGRLAAARSAWALSLISRAQSEYDQALRDESLPPEERGRIYLAKGILEYQEGRYQVAILQSERALKLIPPPVSTDTNSSSSPLRSKAWLLWAESLKRLGTCGPAEEKYEQALAEADNDDLIEINFGLGECRLNLGKWEEARLNFEQVPLRHDRAPTAIRSLATIALEQEKWSTAATWLQKGRSEFPDSFLDSWVDYALAKVAMKTGNDSELKKIQTEAMKRYPPSDYWLSILNAAVEGYAWHSTVSP